MSRRDSLSFECDEEIEEYVPSTKISGRTASLNSQRRPFLRKNKAAIPSRQSARKLNMGNIPDRKEVNERNLGFLKDSTDIKHLRVFENDLENHPNFARSSSTSATSHRSSLSMASSSSTISSSMLSLQQRHGRSLSERVMDPHSPDAAPPPMLERKIRGGARKQPLAGRSNTLPPMIPASKPKRLIRSLSLALGSPPPMAHTVRDALRDIHSNAAAADDDDDIPLFLREHGALDEDLADHEDYDSRGRKKPRARRASIQGTIPSLSSLKRHSSVTLDSPPLPPPIPAGRSLSASHCSPMSKPLPFSVAMGEFMGSPSNSSRASSGRKRGCCGSPISDFMDDGSIGGMSASLNSNSSISLRRSRTRILSPGRKQTLPLSLNPPLFLEKTQAPDGFRSMDEFNSEGEDDHSTVSMGHNDLSFEDNHSVPVITVPCSISNKNQTKETSILETMPSYEDLKFLINSLKKEASRRQAAFEGLTSWTVVLPNTWHSSRRFSFCQWAIHQFQFAVRQLGHSVNVLQVSKSKGQSILVLLNEARAQYKKENGLDGGGNLNDTTIIMTSPFGATLPTDQTRNSNPIATATAGPLFADAATEELASGLQTLTMQETEGRNSEVMLEVGIDFVEAVAAEPRLSMDSASQAGEGALRPSFENYVVGPTFLMTHLHGQDSPTEPDDEDEEYLNEMKPAKMSIGSAVSAYSRCSAPAPLQMLEIMETPQIKQDEGWGSRPVPGKDWGSSSMVESSILNELSGRLDQAVRVARSRESTESGGGLPLMPCGLDIDEYDRNEEGAKDVVMQEVDEKTQRRLRLSLAKYNRISLWAAASHDGRPLLPGRKLVFPTKRGQSLLPVEAAPKSLHEYGDSFPAREAVFCEAASELSAREKIAVDETILSTIFSFLNESELLCKASLVSATWAGAVTAAHAALLTASVGYMDEATRNDEIADLDDEDENYQSGGELAAIDRPSVSLAMDRDWDWLMTRFPWACFLSSGAFKKVFKVHNSAVNAEEALSVMDVDAVIDKKTVAAELVVMAMLSAMSRRGVCPNFVVMHGVFTLPYDVPESHWGCEGNKKPNGSSYQKEKRMRKKPARPNEYFPGRYQCIRMELCNEGDFEEFLKRQREERLSRDIAQSSLFQIAFALHAAAERHSLKHYDTKLLNVFVQRIKTDSETVVLRYGLGSHMFAIRMPADDAFFAKLADYGTANIQSESTGQPVTIAQFTTFENTPPDFMILGDEATQGHGHDNFGLGLSMLHLFTGHAPYEEILEEVVCPPMLKKKLRMIWEDDNVPEYSVIRSIILADVHKDENGHIIEGEPDETLYDTLYRFLVLFGVPEDKFEQRKCPAVWKAISETLEAKTKTGRPKKQGTDVVQFEKHRQKFSIRFGNNFYIVRARESLLAMEGGLDLLFRLCSFNPKTRATALQVLNSPFMTNLREAPGTQYNDNEMVQSFTALSTHH